MISTWPTRLGGAAGVASLLSFSLIAFNDQMRIEVPGTGFCVANGLGLTAAHVGDELFRKLALPEGMPIPRQQRRWEGVDVRARGGNHRTHDCDVNGVVVTVFKRE